MKSNVGSVDQTLRIVAGLVILALGLYYESFWGFIGLVPLFTGLTRWCPAYSLIGVSTEGSKGKEKSA